MFNAWNRRPHGRRSTQESGSDVLRLATLVACYSCINYACSWGTCCMFSVVRRHTLNMGAEEHLAKCPWRPHAASLLTSLVDVYTDLHSLYLYLLVRLLPRGRPPWKSVRGNGIFIWLRMREVGSCCCHSGLSVLPWRSRINCNSSWWSSLRRLKPADRDDAGCAKQNLREFFVGRRINSQFTVFVTFNVRNFKFFK
jgi:hypothetical protein